jgi:hypothetical protein
MSSGTVRAPGAISCPRCGAEVAADQDWCLTCGDAARTRLAPTPNWRTPLALAAVVAALAGLALAVAFVQLTRDEVPLQPTDATTAAPATAPPPAATSTPQQTSGAAPSTNATTPGATTAVPETTTAPGGAETPAPGTGTATRP